MQPWVNLNNMAVNLYVNNYCCTLLYILDLISIFALIKKIKVMASTLDYTKKVLSVAEVLSIFKITRGTLYNWEKAGKIQFTKVGRRKLYNVEDIAKMLNF